VADSLEFDMAITATDQAGNTQSISGTSANVTIDKVAPTLGVATTGSANTTVVVNFTDTTGLDAASVNSDGSDFTVAGTSVTAAAVDSTNKKVTLTVGALASDAKPEVTVKGSVTDKAGNAVVVDSKVTATDGVKAVMSGVTIDKDLAVKDDKVTTTLGTDEKMAVDWPEVSLFGPTGASSNGKLTVTSPTPNNFSAAATVATGDTTGIYGVAIRAKDLGANFTENLTEVADESPTVDFTTDILTLANGPIADRSFNGVLNGETKAGASPNFVITANDVSVTVNGTSTGVTIGAVDASARTVAITSALVTGDVVKVSYSYATDNFEIDQSAPTVTFDPDGTKDVQNQSPFIRLIFDEDEYPGDSFKTVTLTKAELTDPAGVTSDILASFATGDNIEFIWAATDLALGKYTLKVSATDTAGNALTDSSGTFTIAKRTVTLSIRPGWNLVSLPDSPTASSNDVNDVFSSDKIDVVLSFDAIRNNWFSASRQSDGTLGRPGSGLAITTVNTGKGYWVHSTAIVSLKVDVPGLAPGAASQPPSFALTRGWNLVSYTTSDLTDTQQDADDYFTGLDWSRAFGYDNATNKFVSVLPATGTPNETNLDLGKAYWIFLNKAGTLVPP
jgi:Cu/Ag efflux protein CusF